MTREEFAVEYEPRERCIWCGDDRNCKHCLLERIAVKLDKIESEALRRHEELYHALIEAIHQLSINITETLHSVARSR